MSAAATLGSATVVWAKRSRHGYLLMFLLVLSPIV
jgi:hypothetical protein